MIVQMCYKILVIVFVVCYFHFRFTAGDEFNVRIHDVETGAAIDHVLRIDSDEQNVDWVVNGFCEQNNVQDSFCAQLYQTVADRLGKKERLGAGDGRLLPNAHLSRFGEAIEAETSRLLDARIIFDKRKIEAAEDRVVQDIIKTWHDKLPSRVAFVHSCTFNESNSRILDDILGQMQESGLYDSIDRVIILNYGREILPSLKEKYSWHVQWFEVAPDVSYFEIPTLRVMHTIAKYLHDAGAAAHILYLHTKGASYTEVYPQIEDWRNMMLHFLVERHRSCFHLLQSGELDCVGVNYKSSPRRIFSGNFWWSLASHLARLPALHYETSSKYEAETWLLHRVPARIFVMHNTNVNHAVQPYPRSCYADSTRIDALEGNREECGGARTMREHRKYWQLFELYDN